MSDDKFNEILEELKAMHDKKSEDYGTGEDPYANVRASASFGVAPWIGALIRENDKTTRIKSFIAKGHLVNESLEDSLIDKAVYSIIALLLYRETRHELITTRPWRPVDPTAFSIKNEFATPLNKGHTWAFQADKCSVCGLTGMQWEVQVMANTFSTCGPGSQYSGV